MSDLVVRNIGTIVSGDIDSPIAEGDTIVAGPYQQIRELSNGDRVQEQAENDRS